MANRKSPKRDTRFKPGISGNPNGRPRKAPVSNKSRDIIQRALEEIVAHKDGRSISGLEAMILKTRNTVLEHGRPSDLLKFFELCQSLGALKTETQEQQGGVLVVRQPCATAEEWEARYSEAARGKPAPEGFFKRKFRDDGPGGSDQ